MELFKLFSFSPSEEIQKSQNDRIAIEIAEDLSKLIDDFDGDYAEGIPIINESLTTLAKKDLELTSAIIDVLKEKYDDIHAKFPFKINS